MQGGVSHTVCELCVRCAHFSYYAVTETHILHILNCECA